MGSELEAFKNITLKLSVNIEDICKVIVDLWVISGITFEGNVGNNPVLIGVDWL